MPYPTGRGNGPNSASISADGDKKPSSGDDAQSGTYKSWKVKKHNGNDGGGVRENANYLMKHQNNLMNPVSHTNMQQFPQTRFRLAHFQLIKNDFIADEQSQTAAISAVGFNDR
ncbi:hypothetical protein [Endozoicomonas sp. Mp262]|uniref:hypothetical protein n=1 Tax=Endozoicomonas sp. Mp262 TaxID=2919499 RepID=UPI0021D92166